MDTERGRGWSKVKVVIIFFREIDLFCRFEMEGFEVLTNISYNYNTYKPVIIWDIYQVPVAYKWNKGSLQKKEYK